MPTAARVVLGLLCAALLAVAGCNNDDGSEAEAPAVTNREAGAPPEGSRSFPRCATWRRRGVAIEVRTEQGEGSGVIWSAEGEIVTNNHVAAGAEEASVLLASGQGLKAEVVATDPLTDLAVVRVDRDGLPAARFAKGLPEPGALAIESATRSASRRRLQPGSSPGSTGRPPAGRHRSSWGGGRPVATVEDLYAVLRERDPGEELDVAFLRDGERDEATVTLPDRP